MDIKKNIEMFNNLIVEGRKLFYKNDIASYKDAIKKCSFIMAQIMDAGNTQLALNMEIHWYNNLVKLLENEDNFYYAFEGHFKSFWDAGKKKSNQIVLTSDTNINNVVFVVPNPVLLGHTTVMITIITIWKKRHPNLNLYVAGFGKFQSIFSEILQNLGVKIIESGTIKSFENAIFNLKKIIQIEKIHTLIWVSAPCLASYFFGNKLSQRQVMWSLKFHPIHFEDGIINIASTKYTNKVFTSINNKKWYSFTPPIAVSKAQIDDFEFNKIKSAFKGKLIFGTLARTEKFNSPAFLEIVIQILKDCSDSVFLFTGMTPNERLVEIALKNNLHHRIKFVGWVDTNLYSAAIDIFLESFPFGCGITSMQALAQGTRVISMWAEDTIPRWYFANLNEGKRFSPSWIIVKSRDEYLQAALTLYRQYKIFKNLEKNFYSYNHLNDDEKAELFFNLVLKH